MAFAGFKKAKDRSDVVAYLKVKLEIENRDYNTKRICYNRMLVKEIKYCCINKKMFRNQDITIIQKL